MLTNEEVLGRMRTEKEVLNSSKIKKHQYLGHVMNGVKDIVKKKQRKKSEKMVQL